MGMNESRQIRSYKSLSGYAIYQLPIRAFPGFEVNVFLVLADEYRVLIDTGSGFGEANGDLESGFTAISELRGERLGISDLTHILITHAHIDHFGGLPYLRQHSQAEIGVHELDARILRYYEETLAVVSHKLERYLVETGADTSLVNELLDMYRLTKALFHSVPVDFTYTGLGMRLGPFEFLHVPGHTAGHVLIRLEDCVFTGDHILEDTSPHQAPEAITPTTGLEHYLASLEASKAWINGAKHIFTGHRGPLQNGVGRIENILQLHRDRLSRVLEICQMPHSIQQISKALFGHVNGYHVLLALEEAGAHVEYLYQRGLLRVDSYAALENSNFPVVLHYQTIEHPPGENRANILNSTLEGR
jgi:glyoxylase-like metal-dependent hydrolase (beta-lactamase superfamily II)